MVEVRAVPTLRFTIPGAPRTKPHQEWNQAAQLHLCEPRAGWHMNAGAYDFVPFTVPVNGCALFYREALTGDAVGYYQALADALQEARIVENDKLIVSWDGSRLLKDAATPRVEVALEAACWSAPFPGCSKCSALRD